MINIYTKKFSKQGGLREEDYEGEEGFIDPSLNLKEVTKDLLMVDDEKAELFQGYLARHFFRGVASVRIFFTNISST